MKKLIKSMGLKSATAALAMLIFLGNTGIANAQTSSDLQSQIASLLAQIAQLQAQLGSGTASSASFTRDLTVGSQGADVTRLQTFLIGKGFGLSAGATGYFGNQTKAALAAFQATNGIAPAAGYFGPATRAKVNAMVVVTPPSNGNTDTDTGKTDTSGTLHGGEASLRSFDLVAGEDLSEGDTNVEVAAARFEARGGDVRVQRMTVELTGQNPSLSTQPWRYVDTLAVYNGSKKVGSIDTGSKNDWDKSGTTYSIDIPVNTIITEGKKAELSIRADAQNTIDSNNQNQTFTLVIPDNGIRAVDAKGIQQYAGEDGDTVNLSFNGAENGDLTIRESSTNPDAGVLVADNKSTSTKFDVLAFEIRNKNDADSALNELTFRVNASFADSAVTGEDVNNIIRRATLTLDGKTYQGTVGNVDSGSYEGSIVFKDVDSTIDGDDTVKGKLAIELFGSDNHYDTGATLSFDLLSADVDAEGDKTGDASDISGSVTGNTMSISSDAGINVAGRSNTAVQTYNSNTPSSSYGTYTLKFDVTATGDDVYLPKAVVVDGAATSTAGVRIVNMSDSFTGETSSVMTSTADSHDATFYVVREGDTETFTVMVTLNPDALGAYQLGIDYVQFSATNDLNTLQQLDVDQNKAQFHTDPVFISN